MAAKNRRGGRQANQSGQPLLQKAAVYVRVSTHWQIDRDSLPLQREELSNYCKYALNLESFEIFEDAGYSAKNTERPAYQQMMARLRTGEFSHLVVWKIDRISRNLIDFATMYEEIKRLGVAFVSKNEQFDTSSAMGEAMLKIILVFAELERKVTSERVAAVMLSRAANGQWNGGRVPMGYAWDKESGTFSIVETEATIVRMIYDIYAEQKSLIAVAKQLNNLGYKSRRGIAWSPVSVHSILRSPFYIGTYRYNYRDEARHGGNAGNDFKNEAEWVVIEDHHEALIDRAQWEKVAAILTRNRRLDDSFDCYNRKNVHIFAGLVKCGECGSRMTAQHDRERSGGWKPSIYTCSNRRRFNTCTNKAVSDSTLGPFIFNFIANLMKAMKSFGESTSIETLEKKLLRGETLSDIAHIEGIGLQEIYDIFRSLKSPEPMPIGKARSTYAERDTQEIDLLSVEKRRNERALNRLQSLYLYGDEVTSEKDYILKRKRITDELARIDARLEIIEKDRSTHLSISDRAFMEESDNFIFMHGLYDKREVTFVKLALEIDPRILKVFAASILQNFCIKDGKVTSICLKIGVEVRFLYKDDGE